MISYLLDEVAKDLRSALSLTDNNCDVMPDERPKPQCGNIFVGVLGGQITNPGIKIDPPRLYMAYNVLVSITVRSSKPVHSQRGRYIDTATSIHSTLMTIAKRLHGSHTTIMAAAKAALDSSSIGGYYNGALRFVSAPANPNVVSYDWFYANPPVNNNEPIHGLHLTAIFGEVRWIAGD